MLRNKLIKGFYYKRFIGIIPTYWAVALMYMLFSLTFNKSDFIKSIFLIPADLLGIQSVYCSVFDISHNGGTWFVSCIIFCYLFFPLFSEIVNCIEIKTKYVLLVIFYIIMLYSPIIVFYLKLDSIYSNPFFRVIEFSIGVLLCSLKNEYCKQHNLCKIINTWYSFICEMILLLVGVSIAVKVNIAVDNYMMYNWIALPIFSLMLLTLSNIKSSSIANSNIFSYCVKISYVFFFAQFFTWKINMKILRFIGLDCNNFCKIIFSFLICLSISIGLHELVEKPLKKIFEKLGHKHSLI